MDRPLKVVHLCTSDTEGGAARVASLLHTDLVQRGVQSIFLTAFKQSERGQMSWFHGKIRQRLARLPLLSYRKRDREVPFSTLGVQNRSLLKSIRSFAPDVVHVHWINQGFLSLTQLQWIQRQNIPIVWTLHDAWAFTGGCHVIQDCTRFESQCGKCPALNSNEERDLSFSLFNKKNEIFSRLKSGIHFVGVSHWIKEKAERSAVLKGAQFSVIHNGYDETQFFPEADRRMSMQELGLDPNGRYLAFGAFSPLTDPNKGYTLAVQALEKMKTPPELLVFGVSEWPKAELAPPQSSKVRVRLMGHLRWPDQLRKIISSSVATAVPSRQESFGRTALESLACGVPVVCFDTSGLKDVVTHKVDGYRARCFDPEDFARGIEWCIEQGSVASQLPELRSRFLSSVMTEAYLKIYQKLR